MVDIRKFSKDQLQKRLVDAGYDFTKDVTSQLPGVNSKLSDLTIDGRSFLNPAGSRPTLGEDFQKNFSGAESNVNFSEIIPTETGVGGKETISKFFPTAEDAVLSGGSVGPGLLGKLSGFFSGGPENQIVGTPDLPAGTPQPLATQDVLGGGSSPFDESTIGDITDIGEEDKDTSGSFGFKPSAQDKATGLQLLGAGLGQIQAGIGQPSSLEETGGFGTAVAGMLALTGNSKPAMILATISTYINMKGQRDSAKRRRGQQVGFAQAMRDALTSGRKLRG